MARTALHTAPERTVTVEQLERQYGCRYEAAPHGMFPVTHKLSGPCGYGEAAWAFVRVKSDGGVQWAIFDADGRRLIHGDERPLLGRYRAIRSALEWVRIHNGVRVYPRAKRRA
jgi:hypothetical protein